MNQGSARSRAPPQTTAISGIARHQRCRGRRVARRVQRRERRERMELEAVAREPAVDDAVGAGDVHALAREAVRLEVVDVRLELREERERARADVRVPARRQLRQLRRDHLRAELRQPLQVALGAVEDAAVVPDVVRLQPVLLQRVCEPFLGERHRRRLRERRDCQCQCRSGDPCRCEPHFRATTVKMSPTR